MSKNIRPEVNHGQFKWLRRIIAIVAATALLCASYAYIIPVAVAQGGTSNLPEFTATWDDTTNTVRSLVFTGTNDLGSDSKATVRIQYSDNNSTWTNGAYVSGIRSGRTYTLTDTGTVNGQSLDRRWRTYMVAGKNSATSDAITIYNILDECKAGFSSWLTQNYIKNGWGTSTPATQAELYNAFALYWERPSLMLTTSVVDNELIVRAATDCSNTTSYVWEYYDEETDSWITLPGENSSTLNTSKYSESNPNHISTVLDGGRDLCCKVYNGTTLVTDETIQDVDPMDGYYADAIAAINKGLGLDKYEVQVGGISTKGNTLDTVEADLSIYGTNYNEYFYWTNLANDSRVPFKDGKSYANYLASVYMSYEDPDEGLAAAQKIWDKYLYDMYDPSSEGWLYRTYEYPSYTYGDQHPDFPKDNNSSSFHSTATVTPTINELTYEHMERGIDFSNFVSDVDKSATATAPGDANSERKYLIDITADAQAVTNAPVAMILQIQTSWQLFDLMHANATVGEGNTKVGSTSYNTELANLYDIKQALLRFVDYMQNHYPGNNLVLGITETRHSASQTMFYGTDSKGKALYVTNDYDKLREGIEKWDTFGNCEHVHYDSVTLENAVSTLESNLYGWKDFYGHDITYDEIQKSAIIIGGPTENSNNTDGFACVLPWSTFEDNEIDSVYGIRVNEGRSLTGNPISWIDYYENNIGDPYDGAGTNFTEKYVATSEDAILSTLINIAENEMREKGMEIEAEDKYVEDVLLTDVVEDEFRMDPAVPVTATVYNSVKYGDAEELGQKQYEVVIDWQTGRVEEYSFTAGVPSSPNVMQGIRNVSTTADGTKTTTVTFTGTQRVKYTVTENGITDHLTDDVVIPHTLKLVENIDGTTEVSYDFGKVYNTKKCNLNFGIIAEDDFLGSNNVYTNDGTPELTYSHHSIDSDGNETGEIAYFNRPCGDTPQVNVPIRYPSTDGGYEKVATGTTVNLGTDPVLNSRIITAAIEDLVDNYDQTNGTLVYSWTLPDGSISPCGSVAINNGTPEGLFPSLNYDYPVNSPGLQTARLNITFTPDAVDVANRNFKQDGITPIPVNEQYGTGRVWLDAVDVGFSLTYHVCKEWDDVPPQDSVHFRMYDGCGGYLAGNETVGWSITNDITEAAVLSIDADNDWETVLTGLPSMKLDGNTALILQYSPEEIDVSDKYTVSYDSDVISDVTWGGFLKITLRPNAKSLSATNAKYLYIRFTYNGEEYEKTIPLSLTANIAAGGSCVISTDVEFPLGEDNSPLNNITINEIFTYSGGNAGSYQNLFTNLTYSTAEVSPRIIGETSVPVLYINNTLIRSEVTISKRVVNADTDKAFLFRVSLDDGRLPATSPNTTYHYNGEYAEFELKDEESITLKIPVGAYLTILEETSEGFYPVYKIGGTVVAEGEQVTIPVGSPEPIEICVVNTAGYKLPETGGTGVTLIYGAAGILLLASALAYCFKQHAGREEY